MLAGFYIATFDYFLCIKLFPLGASCFKIFMLHRYWFIITPPDRYGPGNIGVTAYSILEAKSIIKEALSKNQWISFSIESIDQAEIIENIDIRLLDQGHILPNIGVVDFKGIWFPNLNI